MNLAKIREKSVEAYPKNFWSLKVMRPLSCYPTWVFLKLGISANQVTTTNLLVGLAGCALLAFGTHLTIILGAFLINLNYLLDRCDGDIARLTNTVTKFGGLADGLSDYLLEILIPISIGVGLYLHPAFGIPDLTYLLLGFTFAFLRASRLRVALLNKVVTGQEAYGLVTSKSIFIRAGLSIVFLEPIVLMILALGNILGLFLMFYTLIAAGELFVLGTLTLTGARKE